MRKRPLKGRITQIKLVKHQTKTSVILRDLRDDLHGDEEICVREILAKLDKRAFGILMFILAAPNCIPNIPGISTVFGLLLIAPALQMMFGAKQVWLPRQIADIKLNPASLRMGIDKAIPMLEKVERFVKPRLEFLSEKPFTFIMGIQVLIISGILILPIPFANLVPGLCVATMALGIVQRDGLLIILSNALFALSLLLAPMGIGAGIAAIKWAFDYIFALF